MLKISITACALIMFLFWIISELAISIAYNHFVQYPVNDVVTSLPLITDIALSVRKSSVILPVVWSLVSFFYYRFIRNKIPADRNEYFFALIVITILIGLLMLSFFGLAGILPYLRIGVILK